MGNIIHAHQQGFMENRPCQVNLISFFALITSLVDEVNSVDEKNIKIFQSIHLGAPHQLDLNPRTTQNQQST